MKFHYQLNTSNTSFLKMSKTLGDLGVKNNKFFLKLFDKSLMHVDPHSEDLTLSQKAKIIKECKINRWYYLREVVLVPVPGGVSRFLINRGNLALLFCKSLNLNTITMLPRQNYKTVSCCADYSWIYLFGTINSTMIFTNKEGDDASNNLKRVTDIIDLLPEYIRDVFKSPNGKDKDNITEIYIKSNNNTIIAKSSAKDPVAANKLGRGLTAPLWYGDEWAFMKYNNVIHSSAVPALSTASDFAKENNKPFGRTITTTPSSLELEEGSYCKQQIDQSAEFTEKMYDMTFKELDSFVYHNSTNNYIYIEYSYLEIGRSKKWFKHQCRELGNDLEAINRELLLKWNFSNKNCPFREEELEAIEGYIKNPKKEMFISNVYKINFYTKKFNPFLHYIVGVDVSGGLSLDNSTLTFIDPFTGKTVADFKNNTIDIEEFGDLIYTLVKDFFPNLVLVIERNSYGKAIIDKLLKKPGFERNLYWEYHMVSAEATVKSDARKTKRKVRKKIYGINTTGGSEGTRNIMINDILFSIVMNEPKSIRSRYIFDDIKGLQRKKTGKIEHGPTSHDDSLFSFLIARYIFGYGTNLKKYVVNLEGIDKSSVASAKRKFFNLFTVMENAKLAAEGNLSAKIMMGEDVTTNEKTSNGRYSKTLLDLFRS